MLEDYIHLKRPQLIKRMALFEREIKQLECEKEDLQIRLEILKSQLPTYSADDYDELEFDDD